MEDEGQGENFSSLKFSRSFFRKRGKDERERGMSPWLKAAGILMIACMAVPLLLMGVSFLSSFF